MWQHPDAPRKEAYQEVELWIDEYHKWATQMIDGYTKKIPVLEADLRQLRREMIREQEKNKDLQITLDAQIRAMDSLRGQGFFAPGTEVYVGPEYFRATVAGVLFRQHLIQYQVTYWEGRAKYAQWVTADEVIDEPPLIPPGGN